MKILTQMYNYFWIFATIILFFIYLKNKYLKKIFIANLIIFWPIISFIQVLTINILIYISWKNDRFFRHLLPPESNYLFENYWQYDFMSYLTTIIISVLIGYALLLVSKKSQEKYLKTEEVLLIFLGCLIVGWSNIIVFVFSIFIFNLLGYLLLLAIKKIKNGDILYPTPYILLAIIFTLLYGYKLSYMTGLY